MPEDPERLEQADLTSVLATIREDHQLHWTEVSRPGFQALAVQRIGYWAQGHPEAALASFLRITCRVLSRYVRSRFGIDLDARARLGRRLLVGHQGGIAIGPDVIMGDDCAIRQGSRIGRVEGEEVDGPGPRIGHRVHIGARATVHGDLVVGDDAKVGPNAVITFDIPARATALARPSKVKRPAAVGGATASATAVAGD